MSVPRLVPRPLRPAPPLTRFSSSVALAPPFSSAFAFSPRTSSMGSRYAMSTPQPDAEEEEEDDDELDPPEPPFSVASSGRLPGVNNCCHCRRYNLWNKSDGGSIPCSPRPSPVIRFRSRMALGPVLYAADAGACSSMSWADACPSAPALFLDLAPPPLSPFSPPHPPFILVLPPTPPF